MEALCEKVVGVRGIWWTDITEGGSHISGSVSLCVCVSVRGGMGGEQYWSAIAGHCRENIKRNHPLKCSFTPSITSTMELLP